MTCFMDLAAQRESCRSYLDKPVEREKLTACVEAARLAPSACNSQPWSFVVVNHPELSPKAALCLQDEGMNRFASQAPAFIVVIQEQAKLATRFDGVLSNQLYASVDVGLAAGQLCLEAADLGLGTCIMGWFDEKRLKALLDIEEGKRIRLVISVGCPANDTARPKVRRPLEEIMRYIGEAEQN